MGTGVAVWPDMEGDMDQAWIDALLREREGYARYGRADRVAAVDAQLEAAGVVVNAEPPVEKRAASKRAPRKS